MKIGILSFGGAYASIPLVEKEIVENQKWMTYEEFADLLALDELTPGPILINSATFVGMKTGGIMGAAAATLGCILPSCLISLVLIIIYRKYKNISFMKNFLMAFKCMAIALIFSTFVRIISRFIHFENMQNNLFGGLLILFAFLILRKYKVNPLYIMLGCGLLFTIFGSVI
jgi:chromate transporter